MDAGEQSVITHGTIEMPKSYADNLDLDQQVSVCIVWHMQDSAINVIAD